MSKNKKLRFIIIISIIQSILLLHLVRSILLLVGMGMGAFEFRSAYTAIIGLLILPVLISSLPMIVKYNSLKNIVSTKTAKKIVLIYYVVLQIGYLLVFGVSFIY